MPIVLRIGAYSFGFFASDESEPPHIHVRRGRSRAKFWLNPVRMAYSVKFAKHDLTQIRKHVIEHREAFLERWHEYFN